MRKEYIIAATILIITIGTILLYLSPDATSQVRRISSAGQKMEVSQDESTFSGQNMGVNSQNIKSKNFGSSKNIAFNNSNVSGGNVNFSNTGYNAQNTKINVNSMQHVNIDVGDNKIRPTNTGIRNTGINTTASNFSNQNYNAQNRNFNTQNQNYNAQNQNPAFRTNNMQNTNINTSNNPNNYGSSNFQNTNVNPRANNIGSNNYNTQNYPLNNDNRNPNVSGSNNQYNSKQNDIANKNSDSSQNEWEFDNLDWATWRSNFLNRILDDSDNIESLNKYKEGSWIWFSFDVTKDGDIENVVVFSQTVGLEDRVKLGNMIKGYAHTYITKFPKNSKRNKVNVKSIFVLDNTEKRADPKDFHDNERIRVK